MEQTNWIWVDIDLLKVDGLNPNLMSKTQREALRHNLEKYGFNMPIITDLQFLIADGEQKFEVAKEMGLRKVPVLKKDLSDTDRRIIRQSMNKIRGQHDIDMDAAEFKELLKNEDMEELTKLIGSSEQEILNIINRSEQEEKEAVEQVKQLGKHQIECPKCHHKFERKD